MKGEEEGKRSVEGEAYIRCTNYFCFELGVGGGWGGLSGSGRNRLCNLLFLLHQTFFILTCNICCSHFVAIEFIIMIYIYIYTYDKREKRV